MASHTLPQSLAVPQISKHGVLTLFSYGVRLAMRSGHLEIEQGSGPERSTFRLPRVSHGLRRVVCISEDGVITLSALKWLSEVDVPFVMLDRMGKVRFVTGPVASSDARLRRAQALALGNGTALVICKELISAKLLGQESLLRNQLENHQAADFIRKQRAKLANADSLEIVRNCESLGAASYWNSWRHVPILWPTSENRIPQHWRKFGTRASPLSGGPRLATTPANAICNYLTAILESETRLALNACGLDPGISLGLHVDTGSRDSLALDVLEPLRPQVELWLYEWLSSEPLRRSDFYEIGNGQCRLMSDLCSQLSETAPTWGKLVAPWVEYVTEMLHASTAGNRKFATRLTQRHKREAKGNIPLPSIQMPKPDTLCLGCGKKIRKERTHCGRCAVVSATERLVDVARLGRPFAHTPEARTKEGAKQHKHALARSSWDASHQAPWLTKAFYNAKIKPRLARASTSAIAHAIGVSRWYAGKIRQGYSVHPRHWHSLARMLGCWPHCQRDLKDASPVL